jgi:uncharacterized protein YecT (DUF1311 family)
MQFQKKKLLPLVIGSHLLCFMSVSAFAAATNTDLYTQANRGNAQAQLAYAKSLPSTSRNEAFKWAQKAADQGLVEAWYWMGQNSSVDDSIKYYKKAITFNYAPAFSAAVDYYIWQGKNADYIQAKHYADLAAQKNISIDSEKGNSKEKRTLITQCVGAGNPQLPANDLSSKGIIFKKDQYCDIFLFGIGEPKDLVKYRLCVIQQHNDDQNINLAEIYANGWGVPRNPNLAMALICHSENLAPAELYGAVDALYQSRNLKELPKPFDFCAHITSGANMGVCAAKDEKLAAAKRTAVLKPILKSWPATHRYVFFLLQKAANNFFEKHATSELDMSGTARNAVAIGEETILKDQFANSVKDFENGHFPVASNDVQADQEMNQAYDKAMKLDYSNYQMGTITKESIKNTQLQWLKYRDAWIKFAALHYPNLKEEVLRTWLTNARIKQLNAIGDS